MRNRSLKTFRLWLSPAHLCVVVVWIASIGCSMGHKSNQGGFGTTGGGGGTSTGNAGVRFVPYSPHALLPQGTQSMEISISHVRLRSSTNGTWTQVTLSRPNFVIHPSGKLLVDPKDLPPGQYSALELRLTEIRVRTGLGIISSTSPNVMRFDGDFTIAPGVFVGLEPQPYADATPQVMSSGQLDTAWASTSSLIGSGSIPRGHILFVTSLTTPATAGIASFDMLCDALADLGVDEGNLPDGFTWKAIVSTTEEHARDRFTLSGNVYSARAGGPEKLIAASDLFDAMVNFETSQSYDEHGTSVSSTMAWTGTDGSGYFTPGYTCSDWSSDRDTGVVGNTTSPNTARFSVGPAPCDSPRRLLCLSN